MPSRLPRRSRYDVFVSYNHGDEKVAELLQTAIEQFDRHWYRPSTSVFRDFTSIAPTGSLSSTIDEALERSEHLLCLLSPGAAKSEWVRRELEWWLRHRGVDTLVLARVSGELVWRDGEWDAAASTALPAILAGAYQREPLWLDLARTTWAETTSPDLPEVVNHAAGVVAAMRGKSKDVVYGERRNHERVAKRLRRGFTTGLGVLLVISSIASVLALTQTSRANEQNRVSTARYLAAAADSLAASRPDLAQLLAVEAYRMNAEPRTKAALYGAVRSNPALVRYFPVSGGITAYAGAADRRTAVVGTSEGRVVRVDLATGAQSEVARLDTAVSAVSTSADGQVLSAVADHGAMLWTALSGVKRLDIGTFRPISTGTAPAGGTVVVQMRNATTPTSEGGGTELRSFDPDGNLLAEQEIGNIPTRTTVVDDGQVMAYAEFGWESRRLPGLELLGASVVNAGAFYQAVALSPDGRSFSFTNGGEEIPVWNTAAARNGPLDPPPDRVAHAPGSFRAAMAFSPDSRRMAVVNSGRLHLSDVTPPGSSEGITSLGADEGLADVQFVGDGNHLLTRTDSALQLWDTTQLDRSAHAVAGGSPTGCTACPLPTVSVSPDGRSAVVLGESSGVLRTLDGSDHTRAVPSASQRTFVGWSPDSRTLKITGTAGGPITDFDVATGTTSTEAWAVSSSGGVYDARGQYVVHTGSEVVVQDSGTGAVRRRFPLAAEGSRPSASVIGPDASRVVLHGDDRIVVADVGSGRIQTFTTSPKLMYLALAKGSTAVLRFANSLEVWNLDEGTRTRSIPISQVSNLRLPVVEPGGALIAMMRKSGSIDLIDTASGELLGGIRTTDTIYGPTSAIGFSPDGRRLVVSTGEEKSGQTSVWSVSPEEWRTTACATAGRDLTPAEWTNYVGTAPPADLGCLR